MHPATELGTVWGQFAVCALLIAFAGGKLSRYGDVIADKSGLSANWIGVALLATVTSLPELITGISAVALAGVPNIAVGNALGSCMVNLSMLVIVDFLYRQESFYRCISRGHILSASFGIILLGCAGLSVLLADMSIVPAFSSIGFYTPIIALLYGVAVRVVMVYENQHLREFAEETADRYPGTTLRDALIGYATAAIVVVAAGMWLPFIGARLTEVMQWHGSFVGTLFIAGATTLPELAVTIGALRVGALDMAIANLLGSNLFNVFILAVDDLFFQEGPLLSFVSPIHAVTAVSAMLMTGTAMIGLLVKPGMRIFRTVGWISICLLTVYLLNFYVLYRYGE